MIHVNQIACVILNCKSSTSYILYQNLILAPYLSVPDEDICFCQSPELPEGVAVIKSQKKIFKQEENDYTMQ